MKNPQESLATHDLITQRDKVSSKYRTWYVNRSFGWRYISSLHIADVLTSSNKSETAIHCCDPALSVHVGVSKRFSRSTNLTVYCLYTFFRLIKSLVDPTLAALIVCDPLSWDNMSWNVNSESTFLTRFTILHPWSRSRHHQVITNLCSKSHSPFLIMGELLKNWPWKAPLRQVVKYVCMYDHYTPLFDSNFWQFWTCLVWPCLS